MGMNDREVDLLLVERARAGDARAFDLLVIKYRRKLARLPFINASADTYMTLSSGWEAVVIRPIALSRCVFPNPDPP